MKTTNLVSKVKVGDKVKTWCCGEPVIGEVIEVNQQRKDFLVSHKPIKWAGDTYTETRVSQSLVDDQMTTPRAELYQPKLR